MATQSTNKKRDNSTLDAVFAELEIIKNQISNLSQQISESNQQFGHLNKKSRKIKSSRISKSTALNKDQFNPSDEKILQLVTTAILYSANQIGVSSTNNDKDLRHTLGVLIPRSCCINFLNINQNVAQVKEKVEIVVYVYDKDDKIELPVAPFVNNVRIVRIKSIVEQLFQSSSSILSILVLYSEIKDFQNLDNILKNNDNVAIISLFNQPKYYQGQNKIIFLPKMRESYRRLIRYVIYTINKNSLSPMIKIVENIKKVFAEIDTPQDFEKGVISLYSPLFANILSTFLEMKPEWKHLIPLVMNQNSGESYLSNQRPWSKIWKTKREFLSHLSFNEFLTCYDSKYQSGANERSKFSSPEVVSTLICNYTEKHEAKNFIFIPMSTVRQLVKNGDFKMELISLLDQITPELIQKAYTKFPFRRTFDFNEIKESIANCLLNESVLPCITNSDTTDTTDSTDVRDSTGLNDKTTEETSEENSDDPEKNEEFTDWQDDAENDDNAEIDAEIENTNEEDDDDDE